MLENYYKKICYKLSEDFKSINNKLLKGNLKLKEESYILDIYMANKNNLKNEVQSIKDISDYLIIRDYNNKKKEIILFNDGVFKGKVKGIFSTKNILEKFNYTELFYINKDIYTYDDGNITFKVVNIKNLGVFLEYKEDNDIIKVTKILHDLKIKYDRDNIKNDYEDIAFDKYIKGKNLWKNF